MKYHHGDSLDIMPTLPDNSVDLILTDPPYFKVKNLDWDRQWNKPEGFLRWLDAVLVEFHRLLKPNGSLYLFASPQMAVKVESLISERFIVLNNIRWTKEAGWHQKQNREEMRSFQSPWESVIFAEHIGAEGYAKGEAGYAAKCDEIRGFVFEPLRMYICDEFDRAGMLNQQGKIAANVACGFSASAGGMASRHYFSQSQWRLPTEEHYEAMRELLNKSGNKYLKRKYEDLKRKYEDLKRKYEDLKREHEDLKREHEDLRRPFFASDYRPYTDVWTYPTVQAGDSKHPCEKPIPMLEHIIETSSRPGAVVLDAFMGSGSTGVACKGLDREFIGIEKDAEHFKAATDWIEYCGVQEKLAI